jgi:Mn2+/Fe2+ NRAMP family transporter
MSPVTEAGSALRTAGRNVHLRPAVSGEIRHKAGQGTRLPREDTRALPSLARLARRQPKGLLKILGPGLIAGASDNDPTTVASLSVIGATTGYALSWLVLLVIPMLVIVQSVSASVGVAARCGLEDAIRKRFGKPWALVAMAAVLSVTVITLAADLEGGAAALGLLTNVPWQWFVVPFAAAAAALLIWGSYAALENVLKYVLLVFLAYIVTAFIAQPDWGEVALYTFIPHLSLSQTYIAGVLALLGTTLTSYAYVWETIEEGEERPPLRRLGLVKADAGIGMIAAGILFWFLVIGTGATLGVHHKPVQTAQDAAQALAPIAGAFAAVLFGIGLLASAVLAVPVLAGTSAYVAAEMFGWRHSLDATFHRAPRFYITLAASLALAAGITFVGIGPIQLLFISSIAGGLGTPITLALMMLVARDRATMKDLPIDRRLAAAGWVVTGIVSLACAIFLAQTVAELVK